MEQIAQGLQYLHTQDPQIIHGDLRGVRFVRLCHSLRISDSIFHKSNVLVEQVGDKDYSLLLTDFGITEVTHITTTITERESSKGALRWMAPEIINPPKGTQGTPTVSSDTYSFAMTCVEVSLLAQMYSPCSVLSTGAYRYSPGKYLTRSIVGRPPS